MREPMKDRDNKLGQPTGKYAKRNDTIGTAYKLARESASMEQREKDLTRQALELMLSKLKNDQKYEEVMKLAAETKATGMMIPMLLEKMMALTSGGMGGGQGMPPLPGGPPAGMPPPLPMGPGMEGSMPSPMPMGDVPLPASPGMAMNDMGGAPPDAMMAPMY